MTLIASVLSPTRRWTAVRLFVLFFGFFSTKTALAQPTISPPQKVWLSLGHSTLETAPLNWQWLQRICAGGRVLKLLQPISGKVSGIVVPVLDGGQCFYATDVTPFKQRNTQAVQGERALRSMLSAAAQAKVPVYLGVDVLRWQKGQNLSGKGIFRQMLALQELNSGFARDGSPEALYASPFNPKVRNAVVALVRELARKFPSAAGVALDMRLSNREILGYSAAARQSSLRSGSLDPRDLAVPDLAEAGINSFVRQWISWRQQVFSTFLKTLATSYKSLRPNGKVLVNGYADYYVDRNFGDLRSSQDWMAWAGSGAVDGVLLEGRWLSRYDESRQLPRYLTRMAALSQKKAKPLPLLPLSLGHHIVRSANYQKEWSALKSHNPTLEQIALLVSSDRDINDAVAVALGSPLPSQTVPLRVGEVLPDWILSDTTRKEWSARELRSRSALLLLIVKREDTSLSSALQSLSTAAGPLRAQGIEPLLVSPRPLALVAGVTNLLDPSREVISQFGPLPALVTVDKTGFIRRIEPLQANVNFAALAKNPTPRLEVGQPAPDFVVEDMNGHLVHLSDFRGRKNLLLTFFPKCFTGGCQNHLTSLRAQRAFFKANDTEVRAVSIDAADVQLAFAERWELPFPLLPDTGRHLSLLYGAALDIEQRADRQSILIDKNGVVRLIDRSVNVRTHGVDIAAKMQALGLAR